jgi:hypothetical protein
MNKLLRYIIGFVVPYALVRKYQDFNLQNKENKRLKLISQTERRVSVKSETTPFSYEASIEFVCELGIDQAQVRAGSIPEKSLEFCFKKIKEFIDMRNPVQVLHIGNFVGVSLAYFTHEVMIMNPASVVFSIDPNVPHRGLIDPQNVAVKVLTKFDLQKNVVLATGYSLEKNISNDGITYDGKYDPHGEFVNEQGCENVLKNISEMGMRTFDVCIIDGNHDPRYLKRELQILSGMIKDGGMLIVDDVSEDWVSIQRTFHKGASAKLRNIAENGRIGIFQKVALTN